MYIEFRAYTCRQLTTTLGRLRQHVTSTIQSYQKQLDELKLERDKHQADSKQGREKLSHALADMSRLRGERQAVLHEYNLGTYARA